LAAKAVHEVLVGGEEDVGGRAVRDLLGEVAGRAEDEGDLRVVGALECRGDLPEGEGQVRRGEDGERRRPRLRTRRAGGTERQGGGRREGHGRDTDRPRVVALRRASGLASG
jgi:hypothetical protein